MTAGEGVDVKLNHQQQMGLRVAADREPDWINAGDLSAALWRDAHERADEDLIWKMKLARDKGSGYGRTLAWLASKGLLLRRFNEVQANHEYRITDEGKRTISKAVRRGSKSKPVRP